MAVGPPTLAPHVEALGLRVGSLSEGLQDRLNRLETEMQKRMAQVSRDVTTYADAVNSRLDALHRTMQLPAPTDIGAKEPLVGD